MIFQEQYKNDVHYRVFLSGHQVSHFECARDIQLVAQILNCFQHDSSSDLDQWRFEIRTGRHTRSRRRSTTATTPATFTIIIGRFFENDFLDSHIDKINDIGWIKKISGVAAHRYFEQLPYVPIAIKRHSCAHLFEVDESSCIADVDYLRSCGIPGCGSVKKTANKSQRSTIGTSSTATLRKTVTIISRFIAATTTIAVASVTITTRTTFSSYRSYNTRNSIQTICIHRIWKMGMRNTSYCITLSELLDFSKQDGVCGGAHPNSEEFARFRSSLCMRNEDDVSREVGVRVSLEPDGNERNVGDRVPSARSREQAGDGVLLESSLCLSPISYWSTSLSAPSTSFPLPVSSFSGSPSWSKREHVPCDWHCSQYHRVIAQYNSFRSVPSRHQ